MAELYYIHNVALMYYEDMYYDCASSCLLLSDCCCYVFVKIKLFHFVRPRSNLFCFKRTYYFVSVSFCLCVSSRCLGTTTVVYGLYHTRAPAGGNWAGRVQLQEIPLPQAVSRSAALSAQFSL